MMLAPGAPTNQLVILSVYIVSITLVMANDNPLQYMDDMRCVIPMSLIIKLTIIKIALIPIAASSIRLICASCGSALS